MGNHTDGGTIYVHAMALEDFAKRSLPKVADRFTLVTGDQDRRVSRETVGSALVDGLLDYPGLAAWFAQNLDLDHPKAHHLPLGLDYHTVAQGRKHWLGVRSDPDQQEQELFRIRAAAPPLPERQLTGYSNWHFAIGNGDRAKVRDALPADPVFYEPERLRRAESWRNNGHHAFTISPPGVGMDCHRTWEAILLGAAPVISDLPINRLFADLPVVIVRDWTTVTPDFLAQQHARIMEREFDFAPLWLSYWRRRFAGQGLPSLRMKYAEFMAMTAGDIAAAVA